MNMNDRDEPPNKIGRFEMDSQYLEGEVTDEGQEEWLSEDILTDDDYNPESHEHSELNTSIHEDTATSFQEETLDEEQIADPASTTTNIEQALDSFENAQSEEDEMALDTFLIRKSDGKAIGAVAPPAQPSPKRSDDGNDTDDLLSVLEDGFKKPKKGNAMDVDEEDEEYMFKGKKLNVSLQKAKNAVSRSANTAVAEDSDVTDCSSDEEVELKKPTKKKVVIHPTKGSLLKKSDERQGGDELGTIKAKTAKVTHSPQRPRTPPKLRSANRNTQNSNLTESVNKKQQSDVTTKQSVNKKTNSVNTHSQSVNKKAQSDSLLKKSVNKPVVEAVQITDKKPQSIVIQEVFKVQSAVKPKSESASDKSDKMDKETVKESKPEAGDNDLKSEQPLMHPEMMDEEFHSDEDSDTGDESLYDDLATTDSETQDDWFTLDIRAERAGEYLPLLGDKAYQLLLEEKARVSEKIDMLRSSLSNLAANSNSQSEDLQKASISVAELDAMLKAA